MVHTHLAAIELDRLLSWPAQFALVPDRVLACSSRVFFPEKEVDRIRVAKLDECERTHGSDKR